MTLSRREALGLLLGAPLAAEACRYLPRRHIDGSIRGAGHDVGHRLRDRDAGGGGGIEPVEVVIVGAGPSGLSAAWRLERKGERRFVVLDLEPRAGGTSAFGTDGVVPYPWGAHYVPSPAPENEVLVELLREVSALEPGDAVRGREGVVVREPEERLFLDGLWHEGLFPTHGASPEDLAEVSRFSRECQEWARRRDARGRRAFTIPVAACSDDAAFVALDRETASAYLERRGYKSARLRFYVDYACRDDYGLTLEQTSAWAMLFYFAARLPDHGSEPAPFLTWPEGNGRLVRHLAAIAGARLRLGQLVTDVAPGADTVDVHAVDSKTGARKTYRARHVILSTPAFVTRRIFLPYRDAPPPHHEDFSYGAWFVANVHLRDRPRSPGFPFAWDNVLYDSPSLGYVVATHQTLRDYGPTIWTYYQPLTEGEPRQARERLLGFDHAHFCDAILADLGRAHVNLEDAIERIDVFRWGHAMIRPVPGFIWGPARRAAARPVGRVHFAHSDLSGIALFEEAQFHGVRAADAVLAELGRVPAQRDPVNL